MTIVGAIRLGDVFWCAKGENKAVVAEFLEDEDGNEHVRLEVTLEPGDILELFPAVSHLHSDQCGWTRREELSEAKKN